MWRWLLVLELVKRRILLIKIRLLWERVNYPLLRERWPLRGSGGQRLLRLVGPVRSLRSSWRGQGSGQQRDRVLTQTLLHSSVPTCIPIARVVSLVMHVRRQLFVVESDPYPAAA